MSTISGHKWCYKAIALLGARASLHVSSREIASVDAYRFGRS